MAPALHAPAAPGGVSGRRGLRPDFLSRRRLDLAQEEQAELPIKCRSKSRGGRLTVESTVDQNPHVETIQVVMEDELLRRVDRAARRLKVNRSALIRQALRQHLGSLRVREREEADRRGYERLPEDVSDLSVWNKVLTWPED
jgi:hypothetical protein